MSAFLAFIVSFGGRLAAGAAKFGLSTAGLALLGPLSPVISGMAQFVGAVVTAIGEILASLSKSAEGRVALALAVALLGFLYLRFHYIEEGKAIARAEIAAMQKPCPVKIERREPMTIGAPERRHRRLTVIRRTWPLRYPTNPHLPALCHGHRLRRIPCRSGLYGWRDHVRDCTRQDRNREATDCDRERSDRNQEHSRRANRIPPGCFSRPK